MSSSVGGSPFQDFSQKLQEAIKSKNPKAIASNLTYEQQTNNDAYKVFFENISIADLSTSIRSMTKLARSVRDELKNQTNDQDLRNEIDDIYNQVFHIQPPRNPPNQ